MEVLMAKKYKYCIFIKPRLIAGGYQQLTLKEGPGTFPHMKQLPETMV